MVKIQGRVRGAAIGVGVTVGLLVALGALFKYTKAGTAVQNSLRGFGQNVGLGIVQPFTGIVEGVTVGASELGVAAKTASEGFQKSVSETLGGGFNVFSDFGKQIDNIKKQMAGEQQPTTATQPKQETNTTPTTNPRPTATNTYTNPTTRPTTKQTVSTQAPQVKVVTTTTDPTTKVQTSKTITTSSTNVKFRQNDGDIVYVSPSTAATLQSRGLGSIVASQPVTVKTTK